MADENVGSVMNRIGGVIATYGEALQVFPSKPVKAFGRMLEYVGDTFAAEGSTAEVALGDSSIGRMIGEFVGGSALIALLLGNMYFLGYVGALAGLAGGAGTLAGGQSYLGRCGWQAKSAVNLAVVLAKASNTFSTAPRISSPRAR